MKKFEITKHARGRTVGGALTELSEAHAAWSAEFGFRIIGFNEDGRRYSIRMDETLVADLAEIHSRRGADK